MESFEKGNHRKERICDSAEKYGWLSLTKTPNSCSWNFSLCTEPRGLPLQVQVQVGVGHNRCKGLLIRVSRASAFLAGSSLDSCGGPSLPCPLPSRPRPLLTGHHRHWGLFSNTFTVSQTASPSTFCRIMLTLPESRSVDSFFAFLL